MTFPPADYLMNSWRMIIYNSQFPTSVGTWCAGSTPRLASTTWRTHSPRPGTPWGNNDNSKINFKNIFTKQGQFRGESSGCCTPRLGGQTSSQETAALAASQAVQVYRVFIFMEEEICVVYSVVYSGFASFHASRPLILLRDSVVCTLYCWPVFSKHKRRPHRRRRRKYPRKSVIRDSSAGDIYSSSNYYRQPESTEDYRRPQPSYQEADYYQEAASSSRRQDSEAESGSYKSWYAGDYTEEFSNSYNYQTGQSDSYPSSYRDRYTQNSEHEPFNWDSWDSKRFSR